jgi:hypothetical protein
MDNEISSPKGPLGDKEWVKKQRESRAASGVPITPLPRILMPAHFKAAQEAGERAEQDLEVHPKRVINWWWIMRVLAVVAVAAIVGAVTVRAMRPQVQRDFDCKASLDLVVDELATFDSSLAAAHDQRTMAPVLSEEGYASMQNLAFRCDKFFWEETNIGEGFYRTLRLAKLIANRP